LRLAARGSREAAEESDRAAGNMTDRLPRGILPGVRHRRRGATLALAAAAWATAVACSSKVPSHPPAIGDCIAANDAGCDLAGGAAGGGVFPGGRDASAVEGSVAGFDAGSCGIAATLIATANVNCVPCVEMEANCCLADQACSIHSDCIALLECAEMCAAGDPTCLGLCENQYPGAVTPYEDFAACITRNCTRECPTLPQAAPSDH
jgi:hypothetical protein